MDEVSLDIEKPKTFCGVVGVYGAENASSYIYYGLNALQHRGQEAAGIVTREKSDGKTFSTFIRTPGLSPMSLRMRKSSLMFLRETQALDTIDIPPPDLPAARKTSSR